MSFSKNSLTMLPAKSSSPQPGRSGNVNTPIAGIPQVAIATNLNVPVHIDVGGTMYTSTLETLTTWTEDLVKVAGSRWMLVAFSSEGLLADDVMYPESRLGKMFNGTIPIVLDSHKRHYFIDRDGGMFHYVLNFLRSQKLILPSYFPFLDMLMHEARYYEIKHLELEVSRAKIFREARLERERIGGHPETPRNETLYVIHENKRPLRHWS